MECSDYRRMKGIGLIKGLQLTAIAEIARRMMTSQRAEAPLLGRAELVHAYLQPIASGLDVEKFWVLCLNRKKPAHQTRRGYLDAFDEPVFYD